MTNILTYKNYTDLCKDLGLPVKSGRGKLTQMNKLKETYVITSSGQSLTLTPKDSEDLAKAEAAAYDLALARDCIRGEGEFADRKCQAIMLLWEQLRGESIEDPEGFEDFRDSSHFSEEIISIGSGIRVLCTSLGLVNRHYATRRAEVNYQSARNRKMQIQNTELETDSGFFREVSAVNKRILDTLFSHIWNTALASGYKSFEVTFEHGQVGVLPPEDALIISTINEKILEKLACLGFQEVYSKGLAQKFYEERNERLQKDFGIIGIEDAYVTRTSEFLLSRYILKNVSKPAQREMIRQLRLRENSVNIRKIHQRIEKVKIEEELALSGKAQENSAMETEEERIQITDREIRKKNLVEQYVRI